MLQWRWIVERTFGWLNRSRRLSKDFEAMLETTETWIRIAMIQLITKRFSTKTSTFQTGSKTFDATFHPGSWMLPAPMRPRLWPDFRAARAGPAAGLSSGERAGL